VIDGGRLLLFNTISYLARFASLTAARVLAIATHFSKPAFPASARTSQGPVEHFKYKGEINISYVSYACKSMRMCKHGKKTGLSVRAFCETCRRLLPHRAQHSRTSLTDALA
jgi:hypothetical protein